jgi:hypothetical protein
LEKWGCEYRFFIPTDHASDTHTIFAASLEGTSATACQLQDAIDAMKHDERNINQ